MQYPHVHHRLVRNYKYNGEITVQSVKWLMAYPLPKYRVKMKELKEYAFVRLHLYSNLSAFLKYCPSPTNYKKGIKKQLLGNKTNDVKKYFRLNKKPFKSLD